MVQKTARKVEQTFLAVFYIRYIRYIFPTCVLEGRHAYYAKSTSIFDKSVINQDKSVTFVKYHI